MPSSSSNCRPWEMLAERTRPMLRPNPGTDCERPLAPWLLDRRRVLPDEGRLALPILDERGLRAKDGLSAREGEPYGAGGRGMGEGPKAGD